MRALIIAALAAATLAAAVPAAAQAQYPTLQGWGGYGGSYYGSYYGSYAYATRYRLFWEAPGLKFDLGLVPKEERKAVSRGIVFVNGLEFGPVDRYDGWFNAPLPTSAGEHEVVVVLEDARIFQSRIFVQPTRVEHVYPRFPPVAGSKPAPADTTATTSPAAPPAPADTAAAQPPPPRSSIMEDRAGRCKAYERYPTLWAMCAG